MAQFPAPAQGVLVTYFIVSPDVERSRRFYTEVLGGEAVLDGGELSIVALANGWVTISGGGGPTDDKPTVTLQPPLDPDHVSSFLNLRVADIHAMYELWRQRGAEFLTPPIDRGVEIRCYMRDPDGYLIEVGQLVERPATRPADGLNSSHGRRFQKMHAESTHAGESSEVARNQWGVIVNHPQWQTLELRWLPSTRDSSDDDFRETLQLLASEGERLRPKFMFIDSTQFFHRLGEGVLEWRDEHVIPRYNAAGVMRFAFLWPDGTPNTVESGATPQVEGSATFPTAWFTTREKAYAWLTEGGGDS
jgi:catechol 2,3-dioxygenase-like lactoylglutathione lyase family enzyme